MLAWVPGIYVFSLGHYGVYVFFVLSGASLYIGYHDKLNTQDDLVRFAVNRVLRILPLFAVVAVFMALLEPMVRWDTLWLNVTMTFGLGNPGRNSMVGGGWSLGIEDCFYLMFPILCALVRTRAWLAIALVLFLSQRAFIESTLGSGMVSAWAAYVQPLAFVSFFFVGMCIGRVHCEGLLRLHPRVVVPAFVALFGAIVVFPSTAEENILRGAEAVALTFIAYAIVLVASQLQGGEWFHKVSKFLGDISYGTYLIHPALWTVVKGAVPAMPLPVLIASFVAVSVSLGWLSNRYFEMPIRAYGRRVFDDQKSSQGVVRAASVVPPG